MTGITGSIIHDSEGEASLDFDSSSEEMLFTGGGSEVGRVGISGFGISTTIHDDVQSPATAFLIVDFLQEFSDIAYFEDSIRTSPIPRTASIPDLDGVLALQAEPLLFSMRRNYRDADGDLLTLSAELVGVTLEDRSGNAEVIALSDSRISYSLIQPDAGIFEMVSSTDSDGAFYDFEVFATDATGQRSATSVNARTPFFRDTDGDGEADRNDDDDDNDGVDDREDEFPLDATETTDNDLDGIGDNADPDDDNDGTPDVDDFYPFDSYCWLESDGDGQVCTLRQTPGGSDVLVDKNGIVYIFDLSVSPLGGLTVRTLDSATGHLLGSFVIDSTIAGLNPETVPSNVHYVRDHDALYVTYADRVMTRVDLTDPNFTESVFKTLGSGLSFLIGATDFSPWVVVREQGPAMTLELSSFDAAGAAVDTFSLMVGGGLPPFTGALGAVFCEEGATLDLTDGIFFSYQNIDAYDCATFGEPAIAPDGSRAYLVDSTIVDTSLAVVGTVVPTADAFRRANALRWRTEGLVLLTDAGLEVFDSDANLINVIAPGRPDDWGPSVKVLFEEGYAIIVYRQPPGLRFERVSLAAAPSN